MQCANCQTPQKEGAKYCHQCGHKVEQEPQASAAVNRPPPTPCPKCGQLPRPGLKFCNHCGSSLMAPPVVEEPKRKKRRRRSSSGRSGVGGGRKGWAIAVVVALFLLAGAGIYYFLSMGKSKPVAARGPLTTEQAMAGVDKKPVQPREEIIEESTPAQVPVLPLPPQPAAAPPVPPLPEPVAEPEEPASKPQPQPQPRRVPAPKTKPVEPPPTPAVEAPAPAPAPAPVARVRPCSEAGLLMRPVCAVEGPQTFWRCAPDGKRWDNNIPGCRRSDSN